MSEEEKKVPHAPYVKESMDLLQDGKLLGEFELFGGARECSDKDHPKDEKYYDDKKVYRYHEYSILYLNKDKKTAKLNLICYSSLKNTQCADKCGTQYPRVYFTIEYNDKEYDVTMLKDEWKIKDKILEFLYKKESGQVKNSHVRLLALTLIANQNILKDEFIKSKLSAEDIATYITGDNACSLTDSMLKIVKDNFFSILNFLSTCKKECFTTNPRHSRIVKAELFGRNESFTLIKFFLETYQDALNATQAILVKEDVMKEKKLATLDDVKRYPDAILQ